MADWQRNVSMGSADEGYASAYTKYFFLTDRTDRTIESQSLPAALPHKVITRSHGKLVNPLPGAPPLVVGLPAEIVPHSNDAGYLLAKKLHGADSTKKATPKSAFHTFTDGDGPDSSAKKLESRRKEDQASRERTVSKTTPIDVRTERKFQRNGLTDRDDARQIAEEQRLLSEKEKTEPKATSSPGDISQAPASESEPLTIRLQDADPGIMSAERQTSTRKRPRAEYPRTLADSGLDHERRIPGTHLEDDDDGGLPGRTSLTTSKQGEAKRRAPPAKSLSFPVDDLDLEAPPNQLLDKCNPQSQLYDTGSDGLRPVDHMYNLRNVRSVAELPLSPLRKLTKGKAPRLNIRAEDPDVSSDIDGPGEKRVDGTASPESALNTANMDLIVSRSPEEGALISPNAFVQDMFAARTGSVASKATRLSLDMGQERHVPQGLQHSAQSERTRSSASVASLSGTPEPRTDGYAETDSERSAAVTVDESTAKKKVGKRSWKSFKVGLADIGAKLRSKTNAAGKKTKAREKTKSIPETDTDVDIDQHEMQEVSPTAAGPADTGRAADLDPISPDLVVDNGQHSIQIGTSAGDDSPRGQIIRIVKQVGNHPELLAAGGLVAFAVFRNNGFGTSVSPAMTSDSMASSQSTFQLARSLVIAALAAVALLGGLTWKMGMLNDVTESRALGHRDKHVNSDLLVDESTGADLDEEKAAADFFHAEDTLLKDAHEQIRDLFPEYDLQILAFPVFLDLVQAPWQEPDPRTARRLRKEAKKHWGQDHKDRLDAALDSLRDIAVRLFADYLKVEDRGAYLTGELLRVEMMSDPDAIRISVFLGDNSEGTDSSEKANWERGLRTIEDLPDKWSEMFPNQTMPPIEIVACRPPADFDSTRFQFLRDCAKAPGRIDRQSRKRYEGVQQQWLTAKSRGMSLLGARKLVGRGSDEQDRMLLDLFKLTQPPRITIDYLPHRHRQADILGWSRAKLPSRLQRASCFRHVARACAAYTKDHDLDILDLGPCLPMEQDGKEKDERESPHFAFSETRANILRISLDESPGSRDANGATEAECLAATLCQPEKGMLSMFAGGARPLWLVLHVRTAEQRVEFRDTLEGCLFARQKMKKKVKPILALMSRACWTSDNSASSTRIWTDAEMAALKAAVESS